jgi:hypothetical protein
LSAAVVGAGDACDQAAVFECSDELRDRSRGDSRAAGEFGAHELPVADRLKRQVLGNGEGWVVRREQALDPATDKRRRANKRFRSLPASDVVAGGPRHWFIVLYC